MVVPAWLSRSLLAQTTDEQLPLQQLDPEKRVAVLMAILGLVLLGGFLVVAIMLGGRWVRRHKLYERAYPTDSSAGKVSNSRSEASASAEIIGDASTKDTMITKPHDRTQIDESGRH